MASTFHITPDVEVVCPRCGNKANFFFPFRKIFPGNLDAIRNDFPAASLEFFPQYDFPTIFCVNQFDETGKAAVSPDAELGLLNIDPTKFDRNNFPDTRLGVLKCGHCGSITKHLLTQESYFYKIAVGTRWLVAGNVERLKWIRDHFANDDRPHISPTEDFPKTFYKHREEIVRKIDAILSR